MRTSGTIAPSSVAASATWPTMPYSALVPAKNQIIGSLAVSRASAHHGCSTASTMSFGPCR